MNPSFGRLIGRAANIAPEQQDDLSAKGPKLKGLIRRKVGEGVEVVEDRAGVVEGGAGGHGQPPEERKRLTVAQRALERLRTTPTDVHSPAPGDEPEEAASAGRGRIVNRHQPGSSTYAFTAAVSAVGIKTAQTITGMSRSAIYAACSVNDPRGLSGLGFEKALLLAGAAAQKGARADLFALPFLRLGEAVPKALPHSANLLHQAAHLGVLYGRTAEALCKMFDRGDGKRTLTPIDPRDRDAALAAIDAQIQGLTAMRSLLMSSTALPPMPFPGDQ